MKFRRSQDRPRPLTLYCNSFSLNFIEMREDIVKKSNRAFLDIFWELGGASNVDERDLAIKKLTKYLSSQTEVCFCSSIVSPLE